MCPVLKVIKRRRSVATALLVAVPLLVAACGGSGDAVELTSGEAPAADEFPSPDGRTLEQLAGDIGLTDSLVVAPAGQVHREGENRYGFGLFTVENDAVLDAQVALYIAKPNGRAEGPFPARVESLVTEPAFRGQTTSSDPLAAEVVYVSELVFDREGEWRLVAAIKTDDGMRAVRVPSANVGIFDEVPAEGDKAPVIETPTAEDVANLAEIDTRVPHDSMHEVDFSEVVGSEPIVLLFATPALCQSRVCGPVVDIAEAVKAERPDDAAYIHMEIFEDNEFDPNNLRPQVEAYKLPTEPFLYVIDEDGRISTVIEGAFSREELEAALDEVS